MTTPAPLDPDSPAGKAATEAMSEALAEIQVAVDQRRAARHDVCDTPATGLPGDEWTCPVCGRQWWAEDVGDVDMALIAWRPA